MNIELHRRLENVLVHAEGNPYGENGGLHTFLHNMGGKPAEVVVEGITYRLEWDSDTHAIGKPTQGEPMPNYTLGLIQIFKQVLTPAHIHKARFIMTHIPAHERNTKLVELLTPLMPKINEITGQENDVRYMAYGLEHVINSRALTL